MSKCVEVTLICIACGRRSEPVEGHDIDRYEWHDAPSDGINITIPPNWVMNLDPFGDGPEIVLCPDHCDQRDERLKASREAWHRRVGGGV
jgi:hypothetical protein